VKVIRAMEDLDHLPNVECITEEMISLKNELAVIVCRNPAGEIKTYPVVEMEFHPEAESSRICNLPSKN
jgi:5-(carboxyamino)imidazole ribonucleotide synthase